MSRTIIFATALVLALPTLGQAAQGDRQSETSYSANPAKQGDRDEMGDVLDRLSQSQLKDRLAAGMERVRRACADDFEELCGSITPGEGRIASCVRDNADELSVRCRATLARVASNIRRTVATIAGECQSGLRAQCGNAEKVGECAEQKSASISPACHTIVTSLQRIGQKLSELKGVDVFSSDDNNVGRVVEVIRGPDGKLQSVQIQIGRFLGIGDKVVSISADKLQELGNRIKLKMDADQLRSLPEAKKRGT
jgi:PRC-barrel domain